MILLLRHAYGHLCFSVTALSQTVKKTHVMPPDNYIWLMARYIDTVLRITCSPVPIGKILSEVAMQVHTLIQSLLLQFPQQPNLE